uniref:Microtubule actin crosslinking factor 1 n=1 Tax=Hucho hucho TaxID=62062 RepID=A0A4W5PXY9_9TELE
AWSSRFGLSAPYSPATPREKGRMRFHRLQNVQIALDFLKQRQVKLVNIRNDDITDGNPKLTLGLIWTIILHFQISEIYVSGESGDLTAKEKLLLWSQQATEGWPGLRCTNFSSSWSNGHMFNALLHRFRPDLIDMEVVAQQSNLDNLEQAFEIAESLGVTRLLDAEDVDVPSPDEKSVITYVSSIYDAFPKIPEGGEGIAAHEVDHRWAEYRSRFSTLLQWSRQHKALMANKNFPLNPVELKALYNEYVHFKETEIPAKELEKSSIERLYKLLEVWMEFGRIKLPLGLHPNDLEEEWGKLILEMLEREKALRPADMSLVESGEAVRCERELGLYLQDCEALIRQLNLDLNVLRDEKYYQVEQLAFRSVEGEGGVGQLVEYIACNARKASSIPGTTHKSKIYARMTDVLERAEWGADLPSVEQNLQDHHNIHTAVEELLHSLKEALSPNFRSSYSDTLAKLEHQYCKLLEHSSWRLRCLESLHAFVCCCTEELIWLNEREEEELAYDWSQNNTNINAKRELYAEMRSELEEKQEVMHSLQETADRLCQENHPAKQTVEAYSAALQTQWQWVRQLCVCVEQHLKDNTAYFQFVSDARDCETYLRQLQDTIKRQYTCDKSSRLGKLEDLLQDSMEEKEQLIEYRSSVASLVGRAKTVVQLRPRSTESTLGSTTPIRAICDYRQIEITISRGEECVLGDNSQRTKWKVISPSGNEAMVPSVCFTVPPPNQEAMDTASRMEQLYQSVMSLWHNLHVNMKSVVSWHYLQKDISTVSSWSLDTVRHTVLTQRVNIQVFNHVSHITGLFLIVSSKLLSLSLQTHDKVINAHKDDAWTKSVNDYVCLLNLCVSPSLQTWQSELEDQEGVFSSLQSAVQEAREAGTQLNKLHPDRSPELERYQERAAQLTERWAGVKRQMDTRHFLIKVEQVTRIHICVRQDYELQLMTFRAFVESTQKSTGKRRRMHSSSDAITQEFMDLRTRYTALVTLTTQHVKYISDALRRLEEEEVLYVSLFFIFFFILSSGFFNLPLSVRFIVYTANQFLSFEQLAAKKEEVAKVIRNTQVFLMSKQASKYVQISHTHMNTTVLTHILYRALSNISPIYTHHMHGLNCGLIDSHISQSLSELESALHLVDQTEQLEGQLLPVAAAMEAGLIKEEVGLRILELQINTGGLRELGEGRLTLNSAGEMGLLSPRVYTKLGSRVNRRELIDPNTADKLNLDELQQRCILSNDTGLYLLPVKQQPGGTVCLRSGRKVGIFRAVQEGLIDRQVTVRLLEAQLFAGGISDPRSGHLLTVNEAEAIQKDLLSPHLALLVLESLWAFIGMLWPESGELLPIAEALQQGVISGELAWNILRQRHAIGALYLPETPKVVSLNQAKEVLEPKVAEILKEIQIPDVLHNMNQSGSPKLNRLIRGSTGTSHPPSSSPEQAHHRLLFHLMTHSYVDAHSGQRLVLLEPELVELVKAAAGLINVDRIPGVVEEGLSLITERQECMEVQLQAQQAQLMQVSQNARSLLDQPDSAVPAKEKRRLRDQLDQLQTQHQEKLRACQERLRRSEALKDELAKFLQEHGGLGTWLEQSEGELCSLGEGETDAQGLKGRLEEHKKLAEDVICHKADLRFVSISGQKVLDSVQGALEKVGGSDPALQKTKQLVTGKLQDANHRYSALHTKVKYIYIFLNTSPLFQKLRQELLSRQGSVEATCDSVSKLLQSSDASTASGLQRSLESLTQSYAAAQAKQAEREAELRGLLPKLENYERLSTDLQGFTQTCLRALSPAGQPDRSVEDYRQTIEVRGGMLDISFVSVIFSFYISNSCYCFSLKRSLPIYLDSRWAKANEAAVQRQVELETCADRLGSFATAASQLGPWLKEKELMMSVLGPLSIDPNMLNTQNQQVQFMLREFETRRPQFDQLTQAAEGILSPSGGDSSPQDAKDLAEVRSELGSISQQWDDLTQRLSQRSEHIDQAQGTSQRYQALLKNLSVNVGALGERLDGQASLSAQPEALKRRLQETGEIRSELEQRREELGEAEKLCGELSAIVVEPYLRDELKKRLESVSGPLRSLEERAADGLSQLQAALSSTQQFQQMFKELRSWLDNQSGQRDSTADSLPCQPEAIRTLLAQQDELHRGVASQRGPYELIQAEGASLLASLPTGGEEQSALLSRLTALRRDWDELNQCITERQNRLKSALTKAESYQQHRDELTPWVAECEEREADIQPSLDPAALDEALQKARQLGLDLERRRPLLEALNTVADQLLEHCRVGEEDVRDEKAQLNRRVDGLAENLQNRVSQLEELVSRLKEFEDGRQAVERRLEAARHQIEVQEALGPQACSNKSLERLRSQQETLHSLQPQVAYLRDLAQGLVQDTPHTEGGGGEGGQRLEQKGDKERKPFMSICCSTLESRLQGVGEVQSSVRDLFSHLADLDDELDSLSPVGRDADSLASQADAVHAFLARLATLRSELEGHGGDCTAMLRREGSSPDLLALRRETEALSRQAGKLSERGQARLGQIEVAAEKVGEFYAKVAELQGLLGRAEEGLNAQGVVGTEVETIKQQLHEFKREQVDSIQPKLQRVNAVGQGLIQSAAKHTDTQALEHDLEATNLRWNSLNKRVAERIAQLQEALLHCGKFQDALEPLLSWLSDTEELVANQKPPSVEYRVVKAQIQEQKLLQRLLDDRRATFQMIQGEGERIAATAETQDRDKIQKQLESLGERWGELLEKARCQLEELQTLALQFHEAVEPLGEWLSATERRLSTAEPMGTQTSKITQQITKHKVTWMTVDRLEALGQSLAPLSCAADRDWLGERVGAVRLGHSELSDWCQRRAVMLEQALANAELFGEDEVEVLNWLAEVGQRLGQVSVQSYQPGVLTQQHKHTLIVSRKKQVDQAIKNGQALLKQTTGEEVLLIQEKLDGIKSRYAEMTAGSSKALRTLEQALQLSTRFASAHDDLNQWLDKVEAELNVMEPDATPAYQDRQKVFLTKRLVLDTVNEVGNALLDLVPWRAREGLDRLVADANQRYRTADETITQRVKLVQAAIQRSQQYEEAVDAELTWAGETERKLSSLGPLSLEPDVTVAQLQVQRAFNIDIIRHKDTVDQLLNTRDDILETCSDQQRDSLLEKTESLSARYEAVSQQHQERFSALEQAQVLVARFWETQEDLEPWLGETETLIAQLPPPAIDTEALRLQQEQMRLLRESIAEHKPHIDKLLKIGPQLAALSHQEGATVRQRYSDAEKRYVAIKEVIKGRATTLDEAVSQSAQFHDKMDPLLETLEGAVQRLRSPPPVAAEADKIREQLADHKATGLDLDKLLPSFSALCARGEELINRAAHDDPAAQAVRSRLLRLRSLWDEIRQRAEEREGKLTDVLDLAGKFWADMAALLSTLRDSQDIVKELEDPGVDPSLIKQQIEAAEAIKAETDGLREELEFVRTLGADLIFACGETEKPEVKKTIDEMNAAWEGLNRTWRERMERLEEAMTASVQYQDALQSMFDYLDNAVIKLCDMSTVGTDLGTVKQQIDELKQYKVEVYQQQIDMEKLCHQGELLLKKVSDQTDRDMIQEPLTELRHLWDNLGDKITHRQHKLEGALLALGQFQHALSELQSWLSHTHATLDTQRPINSDPKAIEIELAKHHVLRNDVLSHRSTVETVNAAGAELLESSPGDEANHLRDQLDHLNRGWENLLLKTQDRQKLLEAALHQAEGFHGELEEFLQWLRRTESQLSAAKPTGGLPETAREQLQQHLSMLLSRGGEEGGPGAGTTQTQQNLALLQNKWASLNTKMDDRRAKLDEAVSLATGFQSSLQDTINWLTQAEQTLNMAQPPSLILDTVLFQIDEHKVFVNEVNTHREQVLALEKAGSQLRFASIKQDVVLIKNLLLSVQARWDKLVQRSLDRGRHLDEARKRAKQFHEAWRKLSDWLEEAESRLDSELEISNEPDKIKEFHFKALGSKQPVYDTTVRSGKAMRDKATLPEDTQKLDHLLGEVRDKWDTVCGKSVERQHKLEEALLFSGQFAEALQALVDWLYRVEPQLAEDLPVHGDLDLVSNLMDSHKAFQKELGKRTTSVHALKRSARELMETGRDDTAWVKVQLQELSNRWDTVCALSVTKQTRLQQAFKQAEEFRTAVHLLLEWLSEAEQTLRFRGVLPEEAETLQTLLHTHRNFMATVEEKRTDVNRAAGQGEAILTACQADCITTIKHWITIIRARFEEVLTWAKQHEQRLETALTELLNNATLLEELLSWLQWAETTLVQRDGETLPQDIPQLKTLITEHQVFMEEMTRKQPDVDKVTKTYKRKPAEAPITMTPLRTGKNQQQQQHQQAAMQVAGGNPRLTQLCSRWQQVWLLALDRQRKLNDALDRLEELKEFASFDFDVWRKRYMRWMNHKKSRVMDFFRRIDKDQDGKITRQEFIDGILASKFPTSRLEMTAVADIFDQDGDGYIDYYEFVAALHPNKDAYRPTTDADKIEDEVTRQVAQCKCAKRFQVEQIGENKYRFFLGNQFGDSQQLRLVRILRSTVMVRVGGGWMALDEFLVKNDPCRARGRTNLELREKFILPEGASQGLAAFRSRGRRSKPGSRTASPTRSSSSASHSAHSCASLPSTPSSNSRGYAKPWLAHSKTPTPTKLNILFFSIHFLSLITYPPPFSLSPPLLSDPRRTPSGASGAASRAGSRAGSRASSRRGSDASDASELLETHSACSDTSDTPRRPGAAKPSKIPTISKKAPSPKTPTSGKK